MEHLVRAEQAGCVTAIAIAEGASVAAGQVLLRIEPHEAADAPLAQRQPAEPYAPPEQPEAGWQAEVDEITRRHSLARVLGGSEKVARQKAQGKLDARERIDHCSIPAHSAKLAHSPVLDGMTKKGF